MEMMLKLFTIYLYSFSITYLVATCISSMNINADKNQEEINHAMAQHTHTQIHTQVLAAKIEKKYSTSGWLTRRTRDRDMGSTNCSIT